MPGKLIIFALSALLAGVFSPVSAQAQHPRKAGWQVRVGAMAFSPLVEDAVRSRAVADSIDADQATSITVRQGFAPAVAVAALLPLRTKAEIEISAGFATSKATGEDDFESWDVASVLVANVVFGIGYQWKPSLALHGGVGMTKLFAGGEGMFAEGNSIRPLVEAGLSYAVPSRPALEIDARMQTHTFATTSLRNEDAEQGSVIRILLGGSYTPGRGVR
jgi:hypothetical protein